MDATITSLWTAVFGESTSTPTQSSAVHTLSHASGKNVDDLHVLVYRSDGSPQTNPASCESFVVQYYGGKVYVLQARLGYFTSLWRSPAGKTFFSDVNSRVHLLPSLEPRKEPLVSFELPGMIARVWGLSDNFVLAWGVEENQPVYYRYDGTEWHPFPSPGTVAISIHGSSPTMLVAVGANGFAAFWDGDAWHPIQIQAQGNESSSSSASASSSTTPAGSSSSSSSSSSAAAAASSSSSSSSAVAANASSGEGSQESSGDQQQKEEQKTADPSAGIAFVSVFVESADEIYAIAATTVGGQVFKGTTKSLEFVLQEPVPILSVCKWGDQIWVAAHGSKGLCKLVDNQLVSVKPNILGNYLEARDSSALLITGSEIMAQTLDGKVFMGNFVDEIASLLSKVPKLKASDGVHEHQHDH